MIDPQHVCRAVGRPELRLQGTVLHTTGVGLPILLGAIDGPNMNWFSTVAGEQAEEIRIIAVRDSGAIGVEHCTPVSSVVSWFIGRHQPVREYELTDRVAERYGMVDGRPCLRDSGDEAPWLVTSHDEHWSSIWPVREPQLHRILEAVLQQLSFVLQRDLDWNEIPPALAMLLRAYPAVRLDAQPGKRGYVRVAVEIPADRRDLLQRATAAVWLPPFEPVGRITLRGATAHLLLRRSKAALPAC